ncbi:MAG: three-Cys-motif partner protein TcmP [Bacteroidetes bacterium]|nr:MAG: three-Cys-motif partner protein TcmP [Bacteroidota bacterium]
MTLPHNFGGPWTQAKLEALQKYLRAYMQIFTKNEKAKYFTTVYVDAFAGTGYRTITDKDEQFLFKDLQEEDNQQFLKGSARIALELDPPFQRYVFIEKDPHHAAELQRQCANFPDRTYQILPGDAGKILPQWIGQTDWRTTRAVVFLDPYGMQVEWSLIEAIANTKAIDLWLLFPLGMAVNRLLTRNHLPPPAWRDKLDQFFGTPDWLERFYNVERDMFGHDYVSKKGSWHEISDFFNKRLQGLFPAVAKPRVLANSRGNPLYLLCFAAGNKKGGATALKIANHILEHTN